MKKILEKIMPLYAWVPTIITVIFNTAVFYGAKVLTKNSVLFDVETTLDGLIPFIPEFIFIYVLSFLQWAISYIAIGRKGRDVCYKYLSAEIIAKFISLIVFISFPTVLTRPEVTGSGFAVFLTKFIYSVDAPTVLFPSFHCLQSWICIRASFEIESKHRFYTVASVIFGISVFFAVLFVKQHAVVDVFAGIAAAEIGILISTLTKSKRLFEKAERFFTEKKHK